MEGQVIVGEEDRVVGYDIARRETTVTGSKHPDHRLSAGHEIDFNKPVLIPNKISVAINIAQHGDDLLEVAYLEEAFQKVKIVPVDRDAEQPRTIERIEKLLQELLTGQRHEVILAVRTYRIEIFQDGVELRCRPRRIQPGTQVVVPEFCRIPRQAGPGEAGPLHKFRRRIVNRITRWRQRALVGCKGCIE